MFRLYAKGHYNRSSSRLGDETNVSKPRAEARAAPSPPVGAAVTISHASLSLIAASLDLTPGAPTFRRRPTLTSFRTHQGRLKSIPLSSARPFDPSPAADVLTAHFHSGSGSASVTDPVRSGWETAALFEFQGGELSSRVPRLFSSLPEDQSCTLPGFGPLPGYSMSLRIMCSSPQSVAGRCISQP